MYLELEAIFNREGAAKDFDYSFPLADELIASDVHVSGSVFKKTGIVTLKAEAAYLLSAECAKCGAPIRRTETVPVEHVLIGQAETEEEEDDYDESYIVLDDLRLDLDELVGEDIFLAMPYRFLCKEDCKGLCPQCGADLNAGPCACKPATDPRWDALKDLF